MEVQKNYKPTLRKIILGILALALVGAAILIKNKLAEGKSRARPVPQKKIASVYVMPVQNGSTPISISTNGNLEAKKRVELYAEVQGIFEGSAHTFKEGVRYRGGETLIRINDDEHIATLRAQKSNLYNQLILLLPDLRLDYADVFPKWQTYIDNFNMEEKVKPLPEFDSEQEKLYILGKGIQTVFFNIKNLEERSVKYRIRAPFTGILTEALVEKGTLVRAGQKLGEFIDPRTYELEVAVNNSYAKLMSVGKTVKLQDVERTRSWQGKVTRVNSRVDPSTQTISTYIQVSGDGLREGMYLEADVTAKEEANTFEVDRKLLVNNSKLYILQDSTLQLVDVQPVYFKENSVVVKGLRDGTPLIAKPVPGAYEGMPAKRIEENENEDKSITSAAEL
ncbi:MAG: HlyD family efflux transporter periplasmic adaptor subunit [Bacteroidota bacterium]